MTPGSKILYSESKDGPEKKGTVISLWPHYDKMFAFVRFENGRYKTLNAELLRDED